MLIEILAKIETMTRKWWGFSKKGQVTIKVTKTQPFLWSCFPKMWFQLQLSWHLGHNLRISSTDNMDIIIFTTLIKTIVFINHTNYDKVPCGIHHEMLNWIWLSMILQYTIACNRLHNVCNIQCAIVHP